MKIKEKGIDTSEPMECSSIKCEENLNALSYYVCEHKGIEFTLWFCCPIV